jgi:site-specific DNA-methyltransferase (adenine-specific)
MEWFDEAFFDDPERDSVDGGTTNLGPLWHGVTPRWGHAMHSMCSYHGMFPAKLVHYFIQQFSEPGDLVLDPFSGRGTVPLQARVEGRRSISNDLNPLAYVLTRAKADPPSWTAMGKFVSEIEHHYKGHAQPEPDVPPDIRMLFHPNTLRQIAFLRDRLLRREIVDWSPEELMLAGAVAGILHGSHRRDGTSRCLSISMPNTFSMSPTYVKNFIRDNKLKAPDQDVFECVRDKLARVYLDSIEGPAGRSFKEDASSLLAGKIIKPGTADLLITSPPYLRVVNYGTANWIRLWWLGIEEVGRQRGAGRRSLDAALDHRHTYDSYRTFFVQTLKGMRRVLRKDGVAVLVIGDVANPGEEPLPLARQLWDDVGDESGLHLLDLIEDHLPTQNKVSRIWGETKGRATDRDCVLVLARDDGHPVPATDVVEWDEPYKDGGPDAAHARLRDLRHAS